MTDSITLKQVDDLLPQTQCGKCGHPGCHPYAVAILAGEPINQCPPGGDSTVAALAQLLDRPVVPLREPAETPRLAVIREAECIGCTKCIQACPVDAILGAPKRMHSVLISECTGCELCVAPCPVDCIDMVAHPLWADASSGQQQAYIDSRAINGRQRFNARNQRLAGLQSLDDARRQARRQTRLKAPVEPRLASNSAQLRQQAAQKRRLIQKRDRLALDDPARSRLDAQIAQMDTGGMASKPAASSATHAKTLRLAVAAAEATQRRAERHVQHCLRQESDERIAQAREQLQRAEEQLAVARESLHRAT